MAELIQQKRVDDIAYSEGHEVDASETIEFALDGNSYRLDVGPDNAELVRKTFGQFIAVATHVPPRGQKTSRRNNQQIRDQRVWAAEQGFPIKDRGRIPREVLDAWELAHRAG